MKNDELISLAKRVCELCSAVELGDRPFYENTDKKTINVLFITNRTGRGDAFWVEVPKDSSKEQAIDWLVKFLPISRNAKYELKLKLSGLKKSDVLDTRRARARTTAINKVTLR